MMSAATDPVPSPGTAMDAGIDYLDGWSGEGRPRWSVEPLCRLRLRIVANPMTGLPGEALICRISLGAWVPVEWRSRSVSLAIGGVRVAEVTCFRGGLAEARIDVPKAAIGWGAVDVDFVLDDVASSPAGHGEGTDERRLGLHVAGATFEASTAQAETRVRLAEAGRAAAKALFPARMHEEAWANVGDLLPLLREAVVAREPFSFVRLGDGEGRILGYPHVLSERESYDETIGYMFGPRCFARLAERFGIGALSGAMAELKSLLHQSIRTCDAIGVPGLAHFAHVHRPERLNATAGFAAVHVFGQNLFAHLPQERIFDTFIMTPFHRLGCFQPLLEGVRRLTVISHSDYSERLSEAFGIDRVDTILIPGHHSFMPAAEPQYPEVFADIIRSIEVDTPGHVYLIAAGYLGKVYADVVKQKGGIAIDVGGVFDGWVGHGRRDMASDQTLRLVGEAVAPAA